MQKKDTKKKKATESALTEEEKRRATPISELLYGKLPLPVKDWLQKYIDGKPTPYADNIDEDSYYFELEMMVAVLGDHMKTHGGTIDLPNAAVDFVKEYLYRIEESSDVHIWNQPEVLRAAWPLMMTMFYDGGLWLAGDLPGTSVVKTALSRLCTRRELAEFYERHGIEDSPVALSTMAGSAPLTGSDSELALKAARILANPKTPAETRAEIQAAINELCMATQVNVHHPALVERALTSMFELVESRAKSHNGWKLASISERRRDRQNLLALLDSIEE